MARLQGQAERELGMEKGHHEGPRKKVGILQLGEKERHQNARTERNRRETIRKLGYHTSTRKEGKNTRNPNKRQTRKKRKTVQMA